jgi:hypothetical protein
MTDLYENFAKQIVSNILEETISELNDRIDKIGYKICNCELPRL